MHIRHSAPFGVGETLYGDHDETEGTMTECRGYEVHDGEGYRICVVPGADEDFTETTQGAAIARRIAFLLQTYGL